MDDVKTENILFVGDSMCGKTSILQVFTKGRFPHESYTSTTFENEVADMNYKKVNYRLSLLETGQDYWLHVRSLLYYDVKVVVIVCSIDSPDTLTNVREYWASEIKKYAPGVPKLLVANKTDLRDHTKKNYIQHKEGELMAKEIGAYGYIECSAMRYEGIEEIFSSIAKVLNKKSSSCVIL